MLEKMKEFINSLEIKGVPKPRLEYLINQINIFEEKISHYKLHNHFSEPCKSIKNDSYITNTTLKNDVPQNITNQHHYWYLIATVPQELGYWKNNGTEHPSIWVTEMVGANTITNYIEYNGVDEYMPPANNTLVESDNFYYIGDIFNG